MEALLRGILVPLAVALVLGAVRRWMPAPAVVSLPVAGERSTPEAQRRDFERRQWIVGFATGFVCFVVALVLYRLCLLESRALAANDGDVRFQIHPSRIMFVFCPVFAGLCFGWEITLRLWRVFSDERTVLEYMQWSDQKCGFDSTRVLRWMGLVIVLPLAVATALALPMRSSLTDTEIIRGYYAQLRPAHFPYSGATRLAVVEGYRLRDGSFARHPKIVVDFSDGPRWSSTFSEDVVPIDYKLLAFLQEKTGLPVQRVKTEPELGGQR